jgi:hypothetical protein
MYNPSNNKKQRSVQSITFLIFLTLMLIAFVSSCKLYSTERSTTREEIKGNPQQRDIPFNNRAIDQVQESSSELPLYSGASHELLNYGMEILLLPNAGEKGKTSLELLILGPPPQNQVDYSLLKTLGKAILLQGLYDPDQKSYQSLAENGIWSSFKEVPNLYEHVISLKLSTASGDTELEGLLLWIKKLLEIREIRDDVFIDALNWQKSCLERKDPSQRMAYDQNKHSESTWLSMENSRRIEKMKGEFTDLFRASNLKLILVGDFDQEKIMRSLKYDFRDLPRSTSSNVNAERPAGDAKVSLFEEDLSHGLHRMDLAYPLPRWEDKGKLDLKVWLLRSLITLALKEGISTVDLRGLPLQRIEVGIQHAAVQDHLKIGGHASNEEEILLLFKRLDETISQLMEEGFTEQKWSNFSNILLKKAKSELRNSPSRSNEQILDEARGYYLYGLPLLSPSQWFSYVKLTLPQLKKSALDSALRSILDESRRSLQVHYQGEPDALLEAQLKALFTKNERLVDEAFSGNAKSSPELPDLDFSSMERVALSDRTKIANNRLERVTLENGLSFLCLKNEAKKDDILFAAVAEGGWKDRAIAIQSEAKLLPILMKENYTPSILFEGKDFYKGKAIALTPFIDEYSHGWLGKSTAEDIEFLLQLFTASIEKTKVGKWQGKLDDFPKVIMDSRRYEQPPGSGSLCSGGLGQPAMVHSRDLSTFILDSLQQHLFADASNFRMVFAGNFNTLILISRAQKYLGNLSGIDAQGKTVSKEVPKGISLDQLNGPVCKKLAFGAELEWSDEELLALYGIAEYLTLVLEKEQMENRLWSWAYQLLPASWQSGRSYSLIVQMKDLQDPLFEMMSVLDRQLEKIRKGDIDPGLFELAKSKAIHRLRMDINSNDYWLHQVIENARDSKDMKLPDFEEIGPVGEKLSPNLMTVYATLYLSEGSRINE